MKKKNVLSIKTKSIVSNVQLNGWRCHSFKRLNRLNTPILVRCIERWSSGGLVLKTGVIRSKLGGLQRWVTSLFCDHICITPQLFSNTPPHSHSQPGGDTSLNAVLHLFRPLSLWLSHGSMPPHWWHTVVTSRCASLTQPVHFHGRRPTCLLVCACYVFFLTHDD